MLDVRARPLRAVTMLSAIAFLTSTAAIWAQQGNPPPGRIGVANAAACARLGFDWEEPVDGVNFAPALALPALPPQQGVVGRDEAIAGAIAPAPIAAGPGFVDRERYPIAPANPVRQVATDPVSTFSIDVDTASYSNVRRFLANNRLPPSDAVRIEELINYFDYGYTVPESADVPFAISVTVTPSPWAEGREIIHIALQGYEIIAEEEPPLNLVFLVDVSGSMWSQDKLPLAQEALGILVDQLEADDSVSIVVYASAAGAVLEPTAGDQKLVIRCAIGSLRAGGSTAGGAGKRDTDIYLSVYGFGRGNYNDLMMQTLSQAGNGTAAYVDTLQEARRLFRDDFSSSFFPIADDVKIQIEFNPARIAEYRLIGYETRLLEQADFNNDLVDAGEVSSGASVTALYEVTPVGGPLAIGPLRYQAPAFAGNDNIFSELAYLSIRYKQPGEDVSELIGRAITDDDRAVTAAKAPEATRWALAVAAFGQLLRGDPYIEPGFGWEAIIDLAQVARGDDPFGIRAEFVQMVRAAATALPLNE